MNPDSELWEQAIAHNRLSARKTQRELQRQLRPRLGSNSSVRVYNTSSGAIVSLGRLESIFATPGGTIASGNMWILTEDGKRLGFKRLSAGNSWGAVKRRYGDDLFIRGDKAFYKKNGRLYLVYRRETQVRNPQLIDFEGSADRAFDSTNLGE